MRRIPVRLAVFFSLILLPVSIVIAPTATGSAGAAVVAPAKASPGFDLPYSWKSRTTADGPDSTKGYDPINMIIVPHGIPPAAIVAALADGGSDTLWHSVDIGRNPFRDRCISAQDAAVQPRDAKQTEQDFSWRTVKCTSPKLISSSSITNHARGYIQKATGAWFLAVSLEHFCLIGKHGITPWHCITKNGYDSGRDELVANLEADLPMANYNITVTYSTPGKYYKAGSVPQKPLGYQAGYDGRVAIVTIKPLPCAPICSPQ